WRAAVLLPRPDANRSQCRALSAMRFGLRNHHRRHRSCGDGNGLFVQPGTLYRFPRTVMEQGLRCSSCRVECAHFPPPAELFTTLFIMPLYSVQYLFGNDAAGRKIFRTDYLSYTIRKPRLACLEGEPYTCGALEAVVVSEVADRGTCRYLGIDCQSVVEVQAAAQRDLAAEPFIDVVD